MRNHPRPQDALDRSYAALDNADDMLFRNGCCGKATFDDVVAQARVLLQGDTDGLAELEKHVSEMRVLEG